MAIADAADGSPTCAAKGGAAGWWTNAAMRGVVAKVATAPTRLSWSMLARALKWPPPFREPSQ
jgi:hypothetical protein